MIVPDATETVLYSFEAGNDGASPRRQPHTGFIRKFLRYDGGWRQRHEQTVQAGERWLRYGVQALSGRFGNGAPRIHRKRRYSPHRRTDFGRERLFYGTTSEGGMNCEGKKHLSCGTVFKLKR